MISAENPSAFNGSTANRTVGGIDSITMMPDVDMLVRENEKYRSALDSLNAMMESEVGIATSTISQNQNMASFL